MAGIGALVLGASVSAQQPTAGQKALMDAYNAGVKLLADGKKEEAWDAFETVITDAHASQDAQAKTVLAAAANNLGMIMFGYGKVEAAETVLRVAVENDPAHAVALNNLGNVLLAQGKVKEAADTYERSVKVDPTLGSAANSLARLLIQSGNHAGAAALLAQNLKVSPAGRHEALLLTAGLFELMREPVAKQETVWEELFKETDRSLAAREALVLSLIGHGAYTLALRKVEEGLTANPTWKAGPVFKAKLTAKTGDTDDALRQFRTLAKNMPDDASICVDLLGLLLEKGVQAEVLERSAAAVKKFPDHSMVWFQRGRALELLANAKEAEKSYHKATELDPKNDRAWTNLARLVEKRGDEKTALVCYSNALRLTPNNARSLFNLGRLYVVKDIDVEVGVKLLAAAAAGEGEGAAEAKQLLDKIMATLRKADDGQTKVN